MASLVTARIGGAAADGQPGQPPAAATNPPRAAAAASKPKYPERPYLLAGLALMALAWAVDILAMPPILAQVRPAAPTFMPPDGVSAFAIFFLAATVVDRIIEPFSSGLVRATPKQAAGDDASSAESAEGAAAALGKPKADALTRKNVLLAGIVAGTSTDPEADAEQAAAEQATADQAVVNGTFIVWAVATLIAVPIVSYFSLSLPTALGVQQANPNVDQLITALVVGAGTKPLHDFLASIEKSSQSQDSDSETAK